MIIQFLLKLVFFYFLYTFLRSVLRSYLYRKSLEARNRDYQQAPKYQQQTRERATHSSEDVFEAEYKVIKEES